MSIFIYQFDNRIRDEAKELIAATEKKSNTSQNDVTEKLGERVQNINYWKFELERGIQGKHSIKTLYWKRQFHFYC